MIIGDIITNMAINRVKSSVYRALLDSSEYEIGTKFKVMEVCPNDHEKYGIMLLQDGKVIENTSGVSNCTWLTESEISMYTKAPSLIQSYYKILREMR